VSRPGRGPPADRDGLARLPGAGEAKRVSAAMPGAGQAGPCEEGIGAMRKTRNLLGRFWNDESGAAAAEYALLLAVIAAGLAIAAGTLGSAISNAMDNAATCIDEGPNCSP
jgi:pilus assembly protein Flp/PilA